MRRLGICEERGSGYDKAMLSIEVAQLSAPEIRLDTKHTHVVLFVHHNNLVKGDNPARIAPATSTLACGTCPASR